MADLIQYAFVGGEISPTLFGRSDLEKYDLAVALARNWFVDYHGGLSTRSGTKFIDFVMSPEEATKFVPFRFAPTVAQTYVVLFGDEYIRFIQGGDYVLEDDVAISGIAPSGSDSVVTTSAAHGYSTGDWVRLQDITGLAEKFDNRTFKIEVLTSTTFKLIDPRTGTNPGIIPSTSVTGNAARIYTLASPYVGDDLAQLRAHQSRNVIYLTHPDFPIKKLTRITHASWTLVNESFASNISAPSGLAASGPAAGSAGVGIIVTAVNADGDESVGSDMLIKTSIEDWTTAGGQLKVTWSPRTGAIKYNVYRTQVLPTGGDVNRAMQVGYIGTAFAPVFVDNNIIPDFTITPPVHYDPFAIGAIREIDVVAAGSGYSNSGTVSASGGGSGFSANPIVNGSGGIAAILIHDSGSGYTSPTITVSAGSSATFTVTLSSAEGTYPRVSTVFQQRKVYAGSDEQPITVWGSKPGLFNNMDTSPITQANDAYEFDLDSDDVSPIKHLLPTRSGLVIMSMAGIWQLTGGSDRAVTPTNALADPQTYTGVSDLPPLPIDTDVLFQEGKGGSIRLLAYNDFTKLFASQDLSILANHLVNPNLYSLANWSYTADPNKVVYATRSDGILLCLTIVKEQNVYGWSHFTTRGYYRDTICVQEDNIDATYFVIERKLGDFWTKTLEIEARRDFSLAEDAFCVDCGLSLGMTAGAGELTPSGIEENTLVTMTASTAAFTSDDVGKFIRAGTGKAVITVYTDNTHVTARVLRAFEYIPESSDPTTYSVWTLDAAVSSVGGLWHLAGMEVAISADGNVLPSQTVSADTGEIDLGDVEASRIHIGLSYSCVAQTLPPTTAQAVIENKPKAPMSIFARVFNTRGIKFGADLDHLYSMVEQPSAVITEPIPLQAKVDNVAVAAPFDYDGQFYIVQEYPLPATILNVIPRTEIPSVGRR